MLLRNLHWTFQLKIRSGGQKKVQKNHKYAQNMSAKTDKIFLYHILACDIHLDNFGRVAANMNPTNKSIIGLCISRKDNTSDLNLWYKVFVCQTIGSGAFCGNTCEIVSA